MTFSVAIPPATIKPDLRMKTEEGDVCVATKMSDGGYYIRSEYMTFDNEDKTPIKLVVSSGILTAWTLVDTFVSEEDYVGISLCEPGADADNVSEFVFLGVQSQVQFYRWVEQLQAALR